MQPKITQVRVQVEELSPLILKLVNILYRSPITISIQIKWYANQVSKVTFKLRNVNVTISIQIK